MCKKSGTIELKEDCLFIPNNKSYKLSSNLRTSEPETYQNFTPSGKNVHICEIKKSADFLKHVQNAKRMF